MFTDPLKDPREKDSAEAVRRDCERTFYEVAICIQELNFVEAEKLTRAFLGRVEAQCPSSDPLRLRALVELSNVLRLLEDFDQADQALIQAIQLAAEHGVGGDKPGSLNDLRMRRAELMRQTGQTQHAVSLSAAVLNDSAAGDKQKVESCIQMAQAHMAAGDEMQHGVCMQMAYAVAYAMQPQSRYELVDIFVAAGASEVQEGRFEEAIRLYSTAVDMLRESPAPDYERIAGIEMYIAEQYERTGDCKCADGLRDRVLRELRVTREDDDAFVMDARQALALGMANHAEGNFERAETLLAHNVTVARDHSDPHNLVKALIALSKTHSARGMYGDAIRDLREAKGLADEYYQELAAEVRIEVLVEFAGLLAECGAREEAEVLFRHAVVEAEDIPGAPGIIKETRLLYSLASLIGGEKPAEARTLIERCHDLLDRLPPSYEPVSRTELRLLSLLISPEETDTMMLAELAATRLAELRANYGEGFGIAQAHLMLQKADAFTKNWNLDDARKELENAKRLLEKQAKDKTSLYAMILLRLADVLSPDDSRVFEYRERCEEIRRRVEQAGQELNDQEPEEFDDE